MTMGRKPKTANADLVLKENLYWARVELMAAEGNYLRLCGWIPVSDAGRPRWIEPGTKEARDQNEAIRLQKGRDPIFNDALVLPRPPREGD